MNMEEAYAIVHKDRVERIELTKVEIDAILQKNNCYIYTGPNGTPAIGANDSVSPEGEVESEEMPPPAED
jgi:hypothetical protein